jgi:hypothetical protein
MGKGITFAQMVANTAEVSFTVMLEAEDGSQYTKEVTLKYYPGRMTEKTIAALQGVSQADEEDMMAGFRTFNTTLCNLIKSWDVWDDEAETTMYPLDPVRFEELPIAFRAQVVQALLEGIRPEAPATQNGRVPH